MRTLRPSPASVIAFVALVAALAGSAAALPGKGAVKRDDLARNAVTGKKVKNNSIGGADVKESSLKTVPSAETAESAQTAATAQTAGTAGEADTVDGISMAKIDFRGDSPTAETVVLNDFGGLTLTAACESNQLQVTATNSIPESTISVVGTRTQFADETAGDGLNDFATPFDVDAAAGSGEGDTTTGQIVYATPAGGVVTVQLNMDEGTNAAKLDCRLSGIAARG